MLKFINKNGIKRLFAVLISGILLVTMAVSSAAEPLDTILEQYVQENPIEGDGFISEYLEYYNPIYQDHFNEFQDADSPMATSSPTYEARSFDETVEAIRLGMSKRYTTFYVHTTTYYDVYSLAPFIFAHTGDPKYGDYLKFNCSEYGIGASGYTNNMTYTINVVYHSNTAQEEEVDEKISTVMSSLELGGKTEYEKIKSIYDYICSHVTYDYDHLNDTSYTLKFSTYAALIQGTAVCQGYATLFYRMCLEAGIDARVITGIGNGGAHGWDIVKIGDLYYNLDSTWDAGRSKYNYFLKSPDNFTDHYRDDEYTTDEFNAAYPMGSEDYDPELLGENITWEIVDGILIISGEGNVNYDHISVQWLSRKDEIKGIVIEEGVTSIGDYAFKGLSNVVTISVASTVTYVGTNAFDGCASLRKAVFYSDYINTGYPIFDPAADVTIYGHQNSAMQIFSQIFGFEFRIIGSDLGDLNQDGFIDDDDAMIMFSFILDDVVPEGVDISVADVYGSDSIIDIRDYNYLYYLMVSEYN